MAKPRATKRKITGGGLSAFGVGGSVSTTATSSDSDVIQALVVFLEDRRVLYNPDNLEVDSQVTHSVIEIRKELTEAIQQLDPNGPAVDAVRFMREACRRFLDEPRQHFRFAPPARHGRMDDPGFFVALGELRSTFGAQLRHLDALFSLKVERQLRDLFPILE